MLRIYFLQQWYGLADEAVAAVPDATTVLNFRHWLKEHDLARALFDEVGARLEERGLLMRQKSYGAGGEDQAASSLEAN
jgi:transposase, IS5 family